MLESGQQDSGFQALRFDDGVLHLLDQRLLPGRETWLDIDRVDDVAAAIRDLAVRGAPAIGIAAAYGAVLSAMQRGDDRAGWLEDLDRLEQARPTAVNLAWAVERMRRLAAGDAMPEVARIEREARAIHRDDIAANRAMAEAGSGLIERGSGVLTHCNTGSLATGGIGTALGVVVAGFRAGRIERVFAGETRPWLQGARLTAWELAREGVPFEVVIDSAAASLMASGRVSWVITGADRIAANGDVANKIGTYSLAVLARHHGVGFMIVAPSSTLDPATPSGRGIEIEHRSAGEIWAAAGLSGEVSEAFGAWNPVFDITPFELIDCIVTETGVYRPPYDFRSPDAAFATKAHGQAQ